MKTLVLAAALMSFYGGAYAAEDLNCKVNGEIKIVQSAEECGGLGGVILKTTPVPAPKTGSESSEMEPDRVSWINTEPGSHSNEPDIGGGMGSSTGVGEKGTTQSSF